MTPIPETSSFSNKKPKLSGGNVMSFTGAPVNVASSSISGIGVFFTTIGTTESVIRTRAITSPTSAKNSVSCFVITSINTNTSGAGRKVTFRIRLDNVTGTIIGTLTVGNTEIQLIVMVAAIIDIPISTSQIVLTRQYVGPLNESGSQISNIGDDMHVTVTQSDDTHTAKNKEILRS